MGWEKFERASSEKKAELRQNNGWGNWSPNKNKKMAELQQNNGWGSWNPNKNISTTSCSYSALRGSAVGPTPAFSRGKEAKYASTVNGKHASSAKVRYAGSNGKYANSNGKHFNYSGPTRKW